MPDGLSGQLQKQNGGYRFLSGKRNLFLLFRLFLQNQFLEL
jgi:hypothetical protein